MRINTDFNRTKYIPGYSEIFRENPSGAAVYKPLAIYERIGEDYLAFLHGLKAEWIDRPARDCFFEVDSKAGWDSGCSLLVLLSKEHLPGCDGILGAGWRMAGTSTFLSR